MQNDQSKKIQWRLDHDGCSLGMLISPSGRVFRIQELGVNAASYWGNPVDNDALIEVIAGALNRGA
jgi:hypothetical protein